MSNPSDITHAERPRKAPAIEFRDVHLAFDDRVILDGISFAVQPGETKIVLGGSGTGKSTILKLALGLLRPDSGQVLIDGIDISLMKEREMLAIRRKIGMIFQDGALFDSLSVFENVGFRLSENNTPLAEIDDAVRRTLRFVDLEDAIDKMPNELSGGMRRRVGIARALIGSPKIILYDEPTAGLDPPTARTICELAMKLRDLEGVSSIFVTHRIDDARQMASEFVTIGEHGEIEIIHENGDFCLVNTRFIMLRRGKIIFSGTDEELWASSDPYIKTFLS
ncbi:MAG: ATP-binding cassette domain-containing protein [Acidobacteria bacterium]|nr:ATP-binding cassette domain-containing protein [Acidobacteriota bacterium]